MTAGFWNQRSGWLIPGRTEVYRFLENPTDTDHEHGVNHGGQKHFTP